jgi:hypothetical protein
MGAGRLNTTTPIVVVIRSDRNGSPAVGTRTLHERCCSALAVVLFMAAEA